MPSIVENQTSITRPIFRQWYMSNRSATYKKTILKFTVFMVVLFGGVLGWFYSQGISPATIVTELLFILIIYIWAIFLLPRSKRKNQYKALCRGTNGVPTRTARFYQQIITVTSESGKVREFYYDKIQKVKETEHLYVLVNDSDVDIILDKNGFQKGTMEQVLNLLPKTKLEIEG